MKKKLFFIIFLLLTICPIRALADHLYDIKMDVNLQEDGSANITEVWDVKADSGSEWYKQLYNLDNQKLSNFNVSMDGKALIYKSWNVKETLEEKSGYYGINYVSDGLELCFGKGDMKRHKFILTYTLSNMIINTSDSQVLYQTFFPNVTADNFSVTVHSYYEFPDTLDVWGYGYKGYAYVSNGKIEMSNEGSLVDNYVVLLVKFPLNTFNTQNYSSQFNSFDDVYSKAEEGTFEYDYNIEPSFFERFMSALLSFISFIFPFMVVIGVAIKASKNGYGYKDNKVIDKKNVPFFRDIPCNKDIYYANALIELNNFGYKESNILGAIILKWVRENKIGFKNEQKGIFNKETSVIDLTMDPTFDDELEKKLFDIMYEASVDGYLEARELEKWSRKNYSRFLNLFSRIKDKEINRLKSENHIYKRTDSHECKKKNVMDDTIYEDSIKLYGLKKFLQEFSSIDTKEVLEVHLWDEYLMFAYLFGIADKVAKQLKNMYPEVMAEQEFNYDTVIFVNNLSTRSVIAASNARSAAESYSSGGGGFSSGGGGGGSFGGGGSMGGR